MIREEHGNLLAAEADALVNTVNTVGVAGKGIALQFRQAFPDNFRAYAKAAKHGEVVPGQMVSTRKSCERARRNPAWRSLAPRRWRCYWSGVLPFGGGWAQVRRSSGLAFQGRNRASASPDGGFPPWRPHSSR